MKEVLEFAILGFGIAAAYTALNLLPFGAAALSVLAALAVAAGIAPRLSEYH